MPKRPMFTNASGTVSVLVETTEKVPSGSGVISVVVVEGLAAPWRVIVYV